MLDSIFFLWSVSDTIIPDINEPIAGERLKEIDKYNENTKISKEDIKYKLWFVIFTSLKIILINILLKKKKIIINVRFFIIEKKTIFKKLSIIKLLLLGLILLFNNGISVNNGIIVKSCINNTESDKFPESENFFLSWETICKTIAVEDNDKDIDKNTDGIGESLKYIINNNKKNKDVIRTCNPPKPNTYDFIFSSFLKDNSRPITNSKKITPKSDNFDK